MIVEPIIIKLNELGYPEDVNALDVLTDAGRGRFRMWRTAQQTHRDNTH